MGVDATHYLVIGVIDNNRKSVMDFFNEKSEAYRNIIDKYTDDNYEEKISKTKSGIHIIADGMDGEYIVVGQIIDKSIEDGLKITRIPLNVAGPATDKIMEKIKELDEKIGTSFGKLEMSAICFTHFH